MAEAQGGHLDLAPTCDFFDRPEVLQLCWVHWWDFVMGIPAAEKGKKSDVIFWIAHIIEPSDVSFEDSGHGCETYAKTLGWVELTFNPTISQGQAGPDPGHDGSNH